MTTAISSDLNTIVDGIEAKEYGLDFADEFFDEDDDGSVPVVFMHTPQRALRMTIGSDIRFATAYWEDEDS